MQHFLYPDGTVDGIALPVRLALRPRGRLSMPAPWSSGSAST